MLLEKVHIFFKLSIVVFYRQLLLIVLHYEQPINRWLAIVFPNRGASLLDEWDVMGNS